VTAGVVVALLAVGVALLVTRGRQQAEDVELEEGLRAATISQGALVVTVNATGKVEAVHEAGLPFLVSGDVVEILVAPGDSVEEGVLLAILDTQLVELDLRDAEIAHSLQKLALEELLAGPSEEELTVARANLALAQARLSQASAPPDEFDLKIADLQIEMARNQLYDQQSGRDAAIEASSTGGEADWRESIGMENISRAELGIQIAELQREQVLQGGAAGAIATARAQVVAAQAGLNSLLDGADEYDLAIVEKQVEIAGLSVELARGVVDDAKIRAPFDGTIAEVNLDVGQAVQAGAPVVTLISEEEYRLTVDVDEVDIANLKVEQPVEIILDALPGEVLTGQVQAISPTATDVAGVVSYPVRVKLDPTDAPLRAGMTATAVVTVDELNAAVLVPNWAVRIDRRTGEAFVSIRNADGVIEEVSVTIGLRNDMVSQVLDGLDTGDEVVVSQDREGLSFFGGGEE
jgi:HlyD family secretion protein